MNDLKAKAKQAGITINLTVQAAPTITSAAVPCTPSQALCKWQAADWNGGWVYADPYLPTGEVLFATGASTNFGSYSNQQANKLIDDTISAPVSHEAQALGTYASFMAQQLPVIYQPTSIGLYTSNAGTLVSAKLGGFAANSFTYLCRRRGTSSSKCLSGRWPTARCARCKPRTTGWQHSLLSSTGHRTSGWASRSRTDASFSAPM